ncbi:hypothetical protein GOBAR_AA12748 [Gossypium barbadense]|uniref:Uncharacterized protein n=1 Tax=Gossypium barbadense TaxID=3634 RepID=A0A2P5XX18_GOSBA|nr:hypothetical protein GOBAR_AA12748 [Gossypium barbadense]
MPMEFNCREHFNWGANDSVATYERCMLKYDSGIAVRANVSARKIGVDKDGHAIRNYAKELSDSIKKVLSEGQFILQFSVPSGQKTWDQHLRA